MSVVVALPHGDDRIVPLGNATTVGALLDSSAVALPYPTAAYDVWVAGDDGEEVECDPNAALAHVGIYGCEERVVVRAKIAYVARARLAEEGIHDAADAAAALAEGVHNDSLEYIRRVAAAGLTPLAPAIEMALRLGKPDAARALVDVGCDSQFTQEDLDLLLMDVCVVGDLDIASLLLAHGANVNGRNGCGHTPLHVAGSKELAAMLLEHGADVNAGSDHETDSPLHCACRETRDEVVALLLECGADVSAVVDGGFTALQYACEGESVRAAALLLRGGADVDAQDNEGDTALHWAAGGGLVDIAALLLEHGAAVNVRDDSHQSPLHWAAGGGNFEVAEMLLAHGAVDRMCGDGRTACDIAREIGRIDIIRLIDTASRGSGRSS